MGRIVVNAQNASHAKRLVKLDEHLGHNIVIQEVKTLRRANTKGWKEGVYEITYRRK